MHGYGFLYTLSGFAVGMLVGMTGVGGGSLMTPILILIFGVHPVAAVGTDLLYAAATKTGGTLMHGFGHTIEWRIVARLAAGSVPMTALTLFVLSRFDISGGTGGGVVSIVLGIALFATAATLIFRRRLVLLYSRYVGELDERHTRALTIAMGALLGPLVSISSVGASLCSSCFIRGFPRRASSAPTLPMRCRSLCLPESVTGSWARSTGPCSARC
jgi:uncharacterized protein